MIVTNIILVTFLVIIETTFVISADKQRLELKQKVIRHKIQETNSSDVLNALSDFGVVRRYLSPVIEKYSVHFPKNESRYSKNDVESRNVIEKLKTSVILRDNILYIFSYLLHGRESGLTEEQYSSLQIVHEILKKKKVYVYNLLPILSRLNGVDKNQQTIMILMSLIKNLPSYLQCTATFLVNEIKQERINLNKLLSKTTSDTFNYLANIDLGILKSKIIIDGDEMKGYDRYSNITEKALGPVFVKLLYKLHTHKLSLSQELFGLILINLPNPNDDPVVEENIRYLYDLSKDNTIDHRSWDLIGKNPDSSDAYTLVFSVLSKILVSNVRIAVKNAAVYVYHHLKLVMTPTYDNPNTMYLRHLIRHDIDIGMLLSAIVPHEFGPDAIGLKDRLIMYFRYKIYRHSDMNEIFTGFNKFAYRDPLDLLIAFLTRLVNRIPSHPGSNLQMIQEPAAALLSILIMKKSTRTFTPFVSPEIDVLILMESLKTLDVHQAFQSTLDSIKFELIAQPQLSVLVSTLLPTEKYNCLTPIRCLISTFQKIQKLRNNLPMSLLTKIQTISYILKTRLIQLQHYLKPQFSFSLPAIKTDIAGDYENVPHFNESSFEIREREKEQKVPNNLNENLYGWKLNKYYNMTPFLLTELENTKSQTTEKNKQMENIIHLKPTKTKVKTSTTTNQVQVTEHLKPSSKHPSKPSQENLPDQPATSLLVTTSKYYNSEINKPSQKTEKEHPSTSVTPYDIEDQFNVDSLNIREEKISPQTSTSKESESQIYSLEEIDKDITTKKPMRLMTTIRKTKTTMSFLQKMSGAEKPITTTTTILPNIESNVPEKPEWNIIEKPKSYVTEKPEPDSNVDISHTKEEEISSQPNASEENESQTYSLEEVKNDVMTQKPTQPTTTIRITTKEETNVPEKRTNDIPENVTTIVLPPSIEPNEPLKIQLSENGVPIVTSDDHNKTVPGLVLPEIKKLLKPANVNNFFSDDDTPIVTQVLQPLSAIFGKNYIKKILQEQDINDYSTNIALLLAVLKKATTYQQVTTNTSLMNLIQKYISTIEYISPTILLPIVVSSKNLISEVVYSTFNVQDLTRSTISEKPPVKKSPDTITIPLVNPKIWLQSINPSDPYGDLLPTLEKKNPFAKIIQPLKNILTSKKIVEILGSDFQPLIYPNKGTLLITLLQKLQKSKTIQMDPELLPLINMYIYAIKVPSMNIQVSEDSLVKMMSEKTGQWQPELTSLIVALPRPKNIVETAMLHQIKKFLDDPTILEKWQITKPPSTMSRGEFLHKIILSALSRKANLKKHVLKAFKYYEDKVEFTDMGALPIMWMWVETYVVKTEVNLGTMIQQTIDFNRLSYKEKIAYNDLITYLAQNPNFLQDNEDFEFQKYKTQGQFIKGLLRHLLKKPQINRKIKKDIQKLLSRVMLTGPGAIVIPDFSGF
ncbi:uncharacterized protein LOC126848770 [Cataglyphis hispanica]|uniref:uncharacterized protein LOC126848770 n=1 Tax=Cataglyphis hispanica TaxID=1086592 RepID=UPI00217FD99A|nr:uncharacterized protein LOC126848770 [Cataglyphis hispanica]